MNRKVEGLLGVTALSLALSACGVGPAPTQAGEPLVTPIALSKRNDHYSRIC